MTNQYFHGKQLCIVQKGNIQSNEEEDLASLGKFFL
jgi:hypothetical protein